MAETTNTAATVSVSGTKVTISTLGGLASGTTVKVRVTSAATETHKEAYKDYTLTVNNATMTGSVTITGTNKKGETLTADTSSISPTGCTLTYQWYTNTTNSTTGGTAISEATGATYTIASGMGGKYIYVEVTASKANYTSKIYRDITDATNNESATVIEVLEVGSYVNYTPDIKSYTTNVNNTGYSSSQTLYTEDNKWRIIYMDESTDTVLISTEGSVNSETYLGGRKALFRGPTELDTICETLYSNESLGLKARSIRTEDVSKIIKRSPVVMRRYAYYPFSDGEQSGTIEYNGNTYTKVQHGSGHSSVKSEKFYLYDGGGIEYTDSDGFKYAVPTSNNPVYITRYNISGRITDDIAIELFEPGFWVADTGLGEVNNSSTNTICSVIYGVNYYSSEPWIRCAYSYESIAGDLSQAMSIQPVVSLTIEQLKNL